MKEKLIINDQSSTNCSTTNSLHWTVHFSLVCVFVAHVSYSLRSHDNSGPSAWWNRSVFSWWRNCPGNKDGSWRDGGKFHALCSKF